MATKTTTGNAFPEVDYRDWRVDAVRTSSMKFDDPAKAEYLQCLARYGLKVKAADLVGISMPTVIRHLKKDPDFAAAYDDALGRYRDRFIDHALTLCTEGMHDNHYRDGELVRSTVKYPIPLIQMEMRRLDPTYRNNYQETSNSAGGVLVVPSRTTPEEWIEAQQGMEKDEPSSNI